MLVATRQGEMTDANKTKRLIGLVCALALLSTEGVTPAAPRANPATYSNQAEQQQSDEKTIEWDQSPNEPIEIEHISIKDVRIGLNQRFSAKLLAEQGGGQPEDWLERLEFTVRNKTNKRITYLAVSLRFPHPWSTDKSVGTFHHFILGVDLRASGDAATYVEPFSLGPGAFHTIRLTEKDLKAIKSLLATTKTPLPEVNHIYLRVAVVGYEDGVEWRYGTHSRPEKLRRLDNKVIEKIGYDNEPCEVVKLSVMNSEIAPIERLAAIGINKEPGNSYEFSASSLVKETGAEQQEWLENFQVTLKNKSDKQITHILLSFQFPETGVNGPMMIFSGELSLGIHPKASAEQAKQQPALVLLPGNTATLRLSPQQLTSIKNFLALRKFELCELNKAVMEITNVFFDDGLMWSMGHYYKPTSKAEHGYERID
jgi:hypothetical protein